MSADLVPPSPFDNGRIPCPQGGEDRWSARWLMDQLGYPRWQDFEPVIERAKTTAHNEGFNVRTLFRVDPEKTAGRPRINYSVTRYAAYLIAMNGDTRKREVSAAQHYFAVKTREAEVAPQPTAIMPTHSEALRGWAEEIEARELAEAKVAKLEPSADAWDRLAVIGADYEVDVAAKILSRDTNINIGRNRLYVFMHDQDWIFRGRHNTWKAYQDQVDLERLKMRPGVEFWDKDRQEYRTGDPSILITPKGLAELRRLLGRPGQLELVTA